MHPLNIYLSHYVRHDDVCPAAIASLLLLPKHRFRDLNKPLNKLLSNCFSYFKYIDSIICRYGSSFLHLNIEKIKAIFKVNTHPFHSTFEMLPSGLRLKILLTRRNCLSQWQWLNCTIFWSNAREWLAL